LDTSKTFESPRNAAGLFEFNAPDEAKAKAPKLGIPLLYAFAMAVGVPRPIAVKGGKTPGAPIPLTAEK
jgi:hypothetical protein